MGSSNISQFEHMTIADLRKLTEDYEKCQGIIKKQEDTIAKLKIKYPNNKVDDDFDLDKFLKELENAN
jgi:hypothetical protein